jgi:Spy/CpxP family protein refolding chaperone
VEIIESPIPLGNNLQKGVGEKMFSRKSLLGILAIIMAFSAVVFAQQPQSSTATAPDGTIRQKSMGRLGGRREGMGRHHGDILRLLRELNLTDEQQQKAREIGQRHFESMKSQREELFNLREKRMAGTLTAEDEARAKALHQEIRASLESIQAEIAGILTAEQKAKLEQLKNERKAKFEERRKGRPDFLNRNPQ